MIMVHDFHGKFVMVNISMTMIKMKTMMMTMMMTMRMTMMMMMMMLAASLDWDN